MRRLLSGDYGHDAFAGHKGMKANRREIYLFALRNPGSTRYAIWKATGISEQTVGRAVAWLAEQGLARLDEAGKVEAIEPEREKAALETIVRNNWTQGKTLKRAEYLEKPWYQIKAERKAQRLKNMAGMQDEPATYVGEQYSGLCPERSHEKADLIINLSTPLNDQSL